MSYTVASIWKMDDRHSNKLCHIVSVTSHCAQFGPVSFRNGCPCVRRLCRRQRHFIITTSLLMDQSAECRAWKLVCPCNLSTVLPGRTQSAKCIGECQFLDHVMVLLLWPQHPQSLCQRDQHLADNSSCVWVVRQLTENSLYD